MKRRHNLVSLFIGTSAAVFVCLGLLHASASRETPSVLVIPAPTSTPAPASTPALQPVPTKKPADEDEVIRVESKLVVVPVSVSDANGRLVTDLVAGDFVLKEGGRKQEIERLSNPEQVPLDIALLIDVSGSVKKRFPFEKKAAERFLRQVFRSTDSITIYAIDEQPVLIQSRGGLGAAVGKLKDIDAKRLPTAFFDTVAEAAHLYKKGSGTGHRRVIVVISDGEDTYSQKFKSTSAVIIELQQSDALFYAINPGGSGLRLNQISPRGQDFMSQMAASTGGAAFVPETDEHLDAAFQQIATELRTQYLLQYYSTDHTGGKEFVPITVEVPARPELRIRARQGYYIQP